MADDALELVRLRNDFYRDNYRRVLGAFLLSIIIITALVIVLLYMLTHPPEPRYFATDPQGRIITLVPLDEPNMSDQAILSWANIAATSVHTYDYVNYRQQLQAASQYFTTEGWQAFMNALQSSNNLDAVIAKKLVVSAVATGTPVKLQEGIIDGRYGWRVQIPLAVTYQSASETSVQNNIATILIVRIPTLTNPQGIGIASFIESPQPGTGS